MKKNNSIKLTLSLLSCLWVTSFTLYAQEIPEEDPLDSIQTGSDLGRMQLKDPKSVSSKYEYDPARDRYVYRKTLQDNDFDIKEPLVLSPQEYNALVRRETMKVYFKEKITALDAKEDKGDDAKKNLLPTYYVRSGLFESIFGSNTIDIKPVGSVELDLGMRYSKQDNPILSPRNRTTYAFDFDQRISLSLLGKVGTRLTVNTNYDTKSTFAFQNLLKLEYTPTEDDIVQKIELGNVSMPINSSLISGAQSLFGVKAQLKFGNTIITGVFSEQKSQTKTVVSQGGGTVEEFQLFALDYDADRHYFLSQYFRNQYNKALKSYPFINTRAKITRIEVWVTNRQNRITVADNNSRNIIALQDLGESQLTYLTTGVPIPDNKIVALTNPTADFFLVNPDSPTDNKNNKYNPQAIKDGSMYLNSNIRDVGLVDKGFNGITTTEGVDYSKLENARKLSSSEYTYHTELGYISLSQRLSNDEVLAVAYEFTIGDQVYRVGEFGNDGVEATVVTEGANDSQAVSTQALVLKMLKSNLTTTSKPIWNLMMKNIYQVPGAYQLSANDFKLNIVYTDPSPLNYITPASGVALPSDVQETPLLKVFNMDRLNLNNDPEADGDGFFDFVSGITVDAQNGRIMFTTVEPFGEHLFEKLATSNTEDYNDTSTGLVSYNANQKKYVFRSLYTGTQAASLQENQKNKFQLKGKFKSTGGDGIPLGAFNVPKGSVKVTAGGRLLKEGIDYTVNYQAGKVQILDPTLKSSNIPIEASVENNSVFGQQSRRFSGVNIEHKFSDKFLIGGTLLHLNEKPLTQKSSFGSENVSNTIYGLNANFSTEVPFLTRLANMYPTIDTEVPSNVSIRSEVAYLKPNTPKGDQFQGESTIYVEDFEGSQSTINLGTSSAWSLASVPAVPEFNGDRANDDLTNGDKRARLSWYTIDPIFYTNQRPGEISDVLISSNKTRRIYNSELFSNTDIAIGQTNVIPTFDLTYYPKERGPYNFNAQASGNTLPNPQENWGGIMRSISSTDFQRSNVEYIQFWIQDPYTDNETDSNNVGKLYFNLGEISEDVLKDGRKQYENGLPGDGGDQNTVTTNWAKVPSTQSLIYAFDSDQNNRTNQDVGYDGLNNSNEAVKFPAFASLPDPAADDYTYFLNTPGDVLTRYKKYNGLDGNSIIQVSDTNRGSNLTPDAEDLNRDNTMNTINAYYEYSIDLKPGIKKGDKYVTDIREEFTVETPDGRADKKTRWIQYKIPIFNPEKTVGGLSGFNSIRFMRMFMTGFQDDVNVRFGVLEFVRGDWRRYENSLNEKDPNNDNPNTLTRLDVAAVNILENYNRYVLPPGVQREQLTTNNTLINQNEQSLAVNICNLKQNDGRGVFKATSVDMRQFKKLKMFIHAENTDTTNLLNDDELVAFIRFGNDLTDNFYEVEIPLKVSDNSLSPTSVWPESNNLDLKLENLTKLKLLANSDTTKDLTKIYFRDEAELDPSTANKNNTLKIGIKGNPDFGLVRNLMVGVKNKNSAKELCGEVWFNELRLADMENKGGMAALTSLDANMADLMTLSATGRMSTIGFGSLEQGPNERSREDIKQYNIVTNINMGKLLPKKAYLNIPLNLSNAEKFITPEYDPFNRDVRLDKVLETPLTEAEQKNIINRATDYTKQSGLSLIGVRKERAPEQKKRIYDIENFTLNYSYNETNHHDFEIESLRDQVVRTGVDFTHSFESKPVEPLKKIKFLSKSEYLSILRDINFKYLPENISFNTNINRQMNRQQFRQIDVAGIGLDPLYRRNFLFDYNYLVNYNLTKSLKLSYTATNSSINRNYLDSENNAIDTFTIWNDFWDPGIANNHKQTLVANYDLPINKIPIFKFIKSSYNYTSNFDWRRSNTALSTFEADNGVTYQLGNTIQNSNTQTLNTTLEMGQFYDMIGLGKSKKKKQRDKTKNFNTPPSGPTSTGKQTAQTDTAKTSFGKQIGDFSLNLLTSVKNIRINYSENSGTVLPGYKPSVGFFGTTTPTLAYVFGSQNDIRYQMARNGYLTDYPEFNQNFAQITSNTLNITAAVELIPDLKIDVIANRLKSDNFTEQYNVLDGVYNPQSPYSSGNYSISTIMIGTAFDASSDAFSKTFETFKSNRLIVANRLAESYYGTSNFPRYDNPSNPTHAANLGYPKGFGKNSQGVLTTSFLAAYTGNDVSDYSTSTFKSMPLPNWTLKYSGLMKLKWFKDNFKRFSLHHGYKSTYSINSYRSNFEYDKNPGGLSVVSGDYLQPILVANINLIEQFNPLMRADFELNSSYKFLAEMKKDRALSLSFDNNLLTEVKGVEYIIGMGYRIKNVTINSKYADNGTNIIKSDINVRTDFSYRNNKTIVRYLDVLNNDRLSGGQNIWSLKVTADYAFSKNLTAIFFYDHSFSKAVISTSFPLTNIRTGFTIRYNFGN